MRSGTKKSGWTHLVFSNQIYRSAAERKREEGVVLHTHTYAHTRALSHAFVSLFFRRLKKVGHGSEMHILPLPLFQWLSCHSGGDSRGE